MYPLRFVPLYKNLLWGGNRLCSYRALPKSGTFAESWEISDRQEGMSVVARGPLRGKTLFELVSLNKEKLLGKGRNWKRFPLLLKIIDAKEPLSVQVHPFVGPEAKNEGWIFLGEKPSSVFAGWKGKEWKTTGDEHKLVEALEKISVCRGDFLYIPGGVVHSIGKSSFLLEVQNNANTCYRLYDWKRRDAAGVERPLQIEEAISCIDWKKKALHIPSKDFGKFRCEHFSLCPFSFSKNVSERVDPSSFLLFFFEEGEGTIRTEEGEDSYSPMTTFLIAADSKEVFFQPNFPTRGFKITLPLEEKRTSG
jgi:mannose-6-phosphate isomerase